MDYYALGIMRYIYMQKLFLEALKMKLLTAKYLGSLINIQFRLQNKLIGVLAFPNIWKKRPK